MYIIIFVRVIATVAQPVEQLIRNQQVRGSNPLGSFLLNRLSLHCDSLFFRYIAFFFMFLCSRYCRS